MQLPTSRQRTSVCSSKYIFFVHFQQGKPSLVKINFWISMQSLIAMTWNSSRRLRLSFSYDCARMFTHSTYSISRLLITSVASWDGIRFFFGRPLLFEMNGAVHTHFYQGIFQKKRQYIIYFNLSEQTALHAFDFHKL